MTSQRTSLEEKALETEMEWERETKHRNSAETQVQHCSGYNAISLFLFTLSIF